LTARVRRRRALLLLSLALASGGLAASQVRERVREVERQVGPLVPVVVAKRDLETGTKLATRNPGRLLAVREVPERFAPRDSLAAPEEAGGLRVAVPVAAGAYLTVGQLEPEATRGGDREGALGSGQRALEVAVAGADALAASPGGRVDVLVSTEPRAGPGRTFLALEDVALLALRPDDGTGEAGAGGGGEGGGAGATAVATLRVTLRQAVYLTAAQNFAREVRLLARPGGDGRRLGRASVSAGEL
jgi:pilus assembly protein CpaB